ncbi:MAG TPA: hypothetical protein VMU59_15540 [Caulobacteraceae bacterium]|nr:hypothetical protein [Caulobacteraceae bacterium]
MASFAKTCSRLGVGRPPRAALEFLHTRLPGWRAWAAVFAGMLILMSTAFLAGRPSVFFDTDGYYLMGENLTQVIKSLPEAVVTGGASLHKPVSDDDQIDVAIMGARSPYYGLLLYAADKIGGAWLLAAIQALAAAWMIYLAWRACAPKAPLWSYLALAGGLAVGATLPLFATFMMPDVFAGLAGLGMVLLLAYGDRLSRVSKIGVTALMAASFSFHTSHSATVLLCLAPAMVLLWLLKAPARQTVRGAALVLAAALVSMAAGKLYAGAFEMRTGHALGRPPFLMARMLADGPGRAYLEKVCTGPDTPYVVCRFKGDSLARSDDILWEDKPGLGVFDMVKPPDQLLMEQQQGDFIRGVIAFDPAGVLGSALRNWWRQLTKVSSHDPLRDPRAFLANEYWQTTRLVDLIPNARACKPIGPGCRPLLSPTPLKWWHVAVIFASALYGVWRLTRADVMAALLDRERPWAHPVVRLAAACVILAALVAVNAAVCGILSGPFSRYQARIVWLAPMAAGLIACALGPAPLMARVLSRVRLRVSGASAQAGRAG